MISALIRRMLDREEVEPREVEDALHAVMLGEVDTTQTAGLLVALSAQQPKASLLAAAARVLRSHRVAVPCQVQPLVDTCGTGGDGSQSFNVSTASALVLAAAGSAVAKHGNRGVSSKVGSADVLEAAGCQLDLAPAEARKLLDATGFVFLFAPAFHPAMRHVAPVRKSLGIRTIFNLLGPLVNPADADHQVLGVYDPGLTRVMASALRELGTQRAVVVHCDGLDELGLHATTKGHQLADGRVEPFRLAPRTSVSNGSRWTRFAAAMPRRTSACSGTH